VQKSENAFVLQGLKASSIRWAIDSASLGWYPLAWLSHMLDVQLWGRDAGMHLLTNAAIHAITACVFFFALRRMFAGAGKPAALWTSAFVEALFVVHPMHVESVAWAAERKDTLSTLFIAVALLLYARSPGRRAGVAAAMALSLITWRNSSPRSISQYRTRSCRSAGPPAPRPLWFSRPSPLPRSCCATAHRT
jgi:hypothetical protein